MEFASADVFISYAREDRDFASSLRESLENRQHGTWLDESSILPADKWRSALRKGIESASVIVVVLSPDWLESEICREELAIALSLGKRLVPIVRRDVSEADVPGPVAELNWIYMRGGDTSGRALDALVSAIETDLDRARMHRDLLVPAIVWRDTGHPPARLLRGRALEEARDWLVASTPLLPRPTELHAEFVRASEKHETRSRRRLIAGLSIGLLLVTCFGILAVVGFVRAEHRRRESLSRQLALQSEQLLATEHDSALLLAVRALDAAPTAEARSALLSGLVRRPRAVAYLNGLPGRAESVALARNCAYAAAGSASGDVVVWDLRKNDLVIRLRLPKGGNVSALAFDEDARRIAAASLDSGAVVWDLAQAVDTIPKDQPAANRKEEPAPVFVLNSLASSVMFAPGGNSLAVGDFEGNVALLDLASRHVTWRRGDHRSAVQAIAFNAAGTRLVTASLEGTVVVRDPRTAMPVGEPFRATRQKLLGMTVRGDGTSLIAGGFDGRIIEWPVAATGREPTVVGSATDRITALASDQSGSMVVTGLYNGTLVLWDVADRHPREAPLEAHAGRVLSVACSEDGRRALSAGEDGRVILWETTPFEAIDSRIPAFRGDAMGVATGSEGRIAAACSADAALVVESPASGVPIDPRRIAADESLAGCALDSRTRQIVLAQERSGIAWAAFDGSILRRAPFPDERAKAVCFAAGKEGGAVAVGTEDGRIWTAGPHSAALAEVGSHGSGPVVSVAITNDGRTIASSGVGAPRLWKSRCAVWKQVDLAPGAPYTPWALAFSPDGTLLAAVDDSGRLTVWSAASGRSIFGPNRIARGRLWSVAWSAMALIAVAGDEGLVLLVDARTYRILGPPLHLHDTFTQRVAFDPSGSVLATAGADGRVGRWDVDVTSWRARACQRAGRDLRNEEWARFLPGEKAETVCGGHQTIGGRPPLPQPLPVLDDVNERLRDEQDMKGVAQVNPSAFIPFDAGVMKDWVALATMTDAGDLGRR